MATINLDFKVKHGLQVNGNTTLSGTSNSVGTITAGNWHASSVGTQYGGTGRDLSGLSGYMVMDSGALVLNASVEWADIANTPTTLAGYGITDGSGIKPGYLMDFATATVPAGYLLTDGSAVSRITYAALFAEIGETWGVGDGSTTFNLPTMGGWDGAIRGIKI